MLEIVVPGLYFLSGICIYAAFSHLSTGLRQPRNYTHLCFSGMCLLASAFCITQAMSYHAADPVRYALLLQWNITFAILFFVMLVWFITIYAERQPRFLLLVLTASLALAATVNFAQPFSLQYASIDSLKAVATPWGEHLTHAVGTHSPWTYFGAAVAFVCMAYTLYVTFRLYRHEHAEWRMLLAVVLFILSMTEGVLARISFIDSFEFGIYGFVLIVIVMGKVLNSQAHQRLSTSEGRFRTLVEQSPFSIQILSPDGQTSQVNAAWEKLWGRRASHMYDYNILEDVQLRENGTLPYIRQGLAGLTVEIPPTAYRDVSDTSAKERWLRAFVYPILDEVGSIREVILMHEDVTERRKAEDALLKNEERLRYMLETSPIAVRIAASGGHKVLFSNRSYARLTNADENKVIGSDPAGYYVNPQDYQEILTQVAQGAEVINQMIELEIPGEGRKWTLASYLPIQYENEPAVLGWFYDITELRQAQTQLMLSARVFAEAQEGIMITDAQGIIVDVNPTFSEITGFSRQDVLGSNPRLLKSDKHPPEFYAAMWRDLHEHGFWQGELWNRRKNGELYAELLTVSALRDDHGNAMHYVGLFTDITQAKAQQQALEFMAHYDVLTRLPNRVLFADRFAQAVARARRDETLLAVCYLDLDGFKNVNDSLGHEAGDQLLIEVAKRIKAALREEDTVSRFGGDEFALLLGNLKSVEQCEQALSRIHRAIAQPYSLQGDASSSIAASTGYTLFPVDEADADTLLRHADQAMYQAKVLGRNRHHLFDTTQDLEMQSQREKLRAIEEAFTRGEFCLYYQPKVDMKRGEIIGAEALIRWRHPQRGIVPPSEFLPVIEGTQLEIRVGQWVIEQAMQQIADWRPEGLSLQVSINISPHHLHSSGFVEHLDAVLARHPETPSHLLQLEVLESSVLNDLTSVSRIISSCRDGLGVSIALDDFGTGYSSLTHLRHLPVNSIKIDQTFVRDMIDDPNDHAIVEGVIRLAEAFRRDVIAEGVESRDHGLMLLALGCTKAQGYGIARPMAASDMPGWIKQYQPDPKWLDYARSERSHDDNVIMMLIIENHHWVRHIEESVMAADTEVQRWPIMDHRKCHSGRWVEHARKLEQFDETLLREIESAHLQLHEVGNRLRHLRQCGNPEAARADLGELHAVHQKIEMMLHMLV